MAPFKHNKTDVLQGWFDTIGGQCINLLFHELLFTWNYVPCVKVFHITVLLVYFCHWWHVIHVYDRSTCFVQLWKQMYFYCNWHWLIHKFHEYRQTFNTLRPRQNGRRFPDDIFKCIFLNENAWISLKISLKFVPMVRIDNIPALVQIRAWRRPGDKPLSEPMMVCLPTHICVTRPQWVNIWRTKSQT